MWLAIVDGAIWSFPDEGPGVERVLIPGSARAVACSGRSAAMIGADGRITCVELEALRPGAQAELPAGLDALAIAPDGRELAGVVVARADPGDLEVRRWADGAWTRVETPLCSMEISGLRFDRHGRITYGYLTDEGFNGSWDPIPSRLGAVVAEAGRFVHGQREVDYGLELGAALVACAAERLIFAHTCAADHSTLVEGNRPGVDEDMFEDDAEWSTFVLDWDRELDGHVRALELSPDGRVAALLTDLPMLYLLDCATGRDVELGPADAVDLGEPGWVRWAVDGVGHRRAIDAIAWETS